MLHNVVGINPFQRLGTFHVGLTHIQKQCTWLQIRSAATGQAGTLFRYLNIVVELLYLGGNHSCLFTNQS